MSQLTFADPRVQDYLTSKRVVVLATSNADGSPLAMPMWFSHDTESLTFVSVDGLAKVHNVRRDPRVSIVAEGDGANGVNGLILRGQVRFLEGDALRTGADAFRKKYSPRIDALWGGRALPDNRVVFVCSPEVVSAWGL